MIKTKEREPVSGPQDVDTNAEKAKIVTVELCKPLKRYGFQGRIYEADTPYPVTEDYAETLFARVQDTSGDPVFQEYKPRRAKKVVETIETGVEEKPEPNAHDSGPRAARRAARTGDSAVKV